MKKPKRIQRKRTKGFKMPENTVYVGRPGKWGNPFKVSKVKSGFILRQEINYGKPINFRFKIFKDKEIATNKAIRLFKKWIDKQIFSPLELKGKDLACWCAIQKNGLYVPCHADILLSLANNLTMKEIKNENIKSISNGQKKTK